MASQSATEVSAGDRRDLTKTQARLEKQVARAEAEIAEQETKIKERDQMLADPALYQEFSNGTVCIKNRTPGRRSSNGSPPDGNLCPRNWLR